MASYKNYNVGDRVWVPHEEDAWLAGRIDKCTQTMLEIATDRGVLKIRPASDPNFRYEPCGSHIGDNVENLVDLDELSEGAILHHVRKRYKKRTIYTYVGSILVAVNPFEKLDIYGSDDIMKARSSFHLYPHVFVTANLAYRQLQSNGKNQSVLISGESGAGKTETTKKVLSFLSKVAPSSKPRSANEPGIEDKILQSNPLLEALGNAKTLRNNNSSRFGKWMKIEFDQTFHMQGCEIINYLLEKTRVVHQSKDERNYHIFYQLLSTTNAQYRSQFHLKSPSDYNYLNQSGCESIPGVNDTEEFNEVLTAMQTLQFPSETMDEVFQVLALVLNLGNLQFVDGSAASSTGEASAVLSRSSQETLVLCAEFLGIESPILLHSLTEKVIQMGRNSMVSIKLNRAQAEDGRDNLSKTIYSNLFDWIIHWVNTTLKTADKTFYSIGILDIFGFEVFPHNSFEQLCINYANEKLQFHFNEVIFHEETQMYLAEGISLEKVVFEDNSECVTLIEGKPIGIFSLLDEECSLGKATDLTFISKLEKTFGTGKQFANNYFIKHRTKQDIFTVKHFAGGVEYSVQDFLEKNRDTMSQTTVNMLKLCQTKLIQDLFADDVSTDSPAPSTSKGVGGKSAVTANKQTVGGKFRGQLIGLVNNLYTTEPHFIRCVKPNHNKAAQQMDGPLTLRQLRYAGLFEAIRIRKSGYSYRANHDTFANTYQILVDDLRAQRIKQQISDSEACETILDCMTREKLFPRDVWAIGKTKVFLKSNIHRTYLERRKATRVTMFVIAIQSLIRGFFVRAKYRKVRDAWITEKNRLLILAKKQYGAAVVIQKNIRRYLVMSSLSILRDLVRLRRFVKRQDIPNIKSLVGDLEEQIQALMTSSSTSPSSSEKKPRRSNQILKYHVKSQVMDKSMNILTIRVFQKEIMLAKACVKLNEIQEHYLEELRTAIEQNDVVLLNRLLVKADRFDLQNNELIAKGKVSLSQLNEKRDVIKQMISFLQNESDDNVINQSPSKQKKPRDLLEPSSQDDDEDELFNQSSNMQALIQRAKELDIDRDFISKVERVYVSIGPRIEARSLLRRAIESVDRYGILKGIKEVESLQIHHPYFADMEVRSGNAMLRLLDFDHQLCHPSEAAAANGSEEDGDDDLLVNRPPASAMKKPVRRGDTIDESDSPRLSKELIRICDDISLLTAAIRSSSSSNNNTQSAEYVAKLKQRLSNMKQQLRNYAKTPDELEMIIRSYKWTKLLCPWKFPEVTGKPSSRSSLSNQIDMNSSGGASVKVVEKQDEEFYGLNITEARSSGYLIKLLHREIDPVIGDVPASLQASIGGPNLPYAVVRVLDEVEEVERFNQSMQRHSKASENFSGSPVAQAIKRDSTSTSSTLSDSKAAKTDKHASIKNSKSSTMNQSMSLKDQLLQSRINVEKQRKILESTKKKLVKEEKKRLWK